MLKENVNVQKRKSVQKGIITVVAIGAGLIGLSKFVEAVPQLNIRSADGVKGSVIQGVGTKRLTVKATEPTAPDESDIWVDTA